MHAAAAYAESHKFWYPNEPPMKDYFTQRLARHDGTVNFQPP